jgi:hypothetical protein
MRSNFVTRLSLGILALCLCLECAGESKAQEALQGDLLQAETILKAARLKSLGFDYVQSTDAQSDADVYESLEQAFRTPDKVRHLVLKKFDPEMKHLPARLGTLINLEKLEMSCLEKLEDLPVEIGKLRKLEELIIDNGNGCQMNISVPRSIGQLENLKVLTLYGALDPREIGSEQPLRPSQIKKLPQTLGNLRNLEELELGRNGLRVVPAEIASLHKLKRLGLDYNNIRELPSSIGNLKNLRELSLRSNGGVRLPQSLAALKNLRVYLGNNYLKLKDQQKLRSRFPKIVFSFDNEFDDEAANEQPAAPKSKARRARKR